MRKMAWRKKKDEGILKSMQPLNKVKFYFCFLASTLLCSVSGKEIDRRQITYLLQSSEINAAFALYDLHKNTLGKHDFEVLQQIAQIFLQEGANTNDPEKQLLSLYGCSIAGSSHSLDVLENFLTSQHPQTQAASIQLIGQMQEDRSSDLLNKAMSSDFFPVRMEAAYQLSLRKHPSACGQIEGLMYRVPKEFRFFFPRFFALIGTADAASVLKHLVSDPTLSVRIEAILSAAQFGRDDLLPLIRARATHLNHAEQEACIAALGSLNDSRSIPLLHKCAQSASSTVQLASLCALHTLGETSAKEKICEFARAKNLFALSLLGQLPDTQEVLAELVKEKEMQVHLNATLALLKQKDRRCLPSLFEILLPGSRGLGLMPQFSVGRSLTAWKFVPSAKQKGKEEGYDLEAFSLSVREQILTEALELAEEDFLHIAEVIFESKQSELIPLLVSLLENIQTEKAVRLLERMSEQAGVPLTRSYCSLALFRLFHREENLKQIRDWITAKQQTELIRFRPTLPLDQRKQTASHFELTPEESSRLLIEMYQALADRHDDKGIDILLEGIRSGNSKNRPVLAGLLLRALQ
jgi:HEAT repeat protein